MNVNFGEHVASLCKKISKQIAIVNRFRRLLITKAKLSNCIRPKYYLTSSIAPHPHCDTPNLKIDLNERTMRCIFNDKTSTYDALLERVNMSTLQNRRIQNVCILIYKAIHGSTPVDLCHSATMLSLRRIKSFVFARLAWH